MRGEAGLAHVLWIGGPPAAGKTTVAARLARRYGLRLYSTDTTTWTHVDRLRAQGSEAARAWHELGPEERWAGRDPIARSLYFERGPLILEDLRRLPAHPVILAEGSALPAGAADPEKALWIVPNAALHDERLAARGTTGGRARLDRRLRELIAHEARTAGLPTHKGTGDVTREAERRFAPFFGTPGDRRALIREANAAIAAQVRGYHARPWATGDPDKVVRGFACECGDPACEEIVALPVGVLWVGPVLASGHVVSISRALVRRIGDGPH